jgi:hypothetical protein
MESICTAGTSDSALSTGDVSVLEQAAAPVSRKAASRNLNLNLAPGDEVSMNYSRFRSGPCLSTACCMAIKPILRFRAKSDSVR